MNTKKEMLLVVGYWLLFWIIPAIALLYMPVQGDASAAFSYFDRWALASLLLPVIYIICLQIGAPEKLKKIVMYILLPLLVVAALLVSQLQFGTGGF